MKKLFIAIAILGVVFTSCVDQDRIFAEQRAFNERVNQEMIRDMRQTNEMINQEMQRQMRADAQMMRDIERQARIDANPYDPSQSY
jgi:hypothetical protein